MLLVLQCENKQNKIKKKIQIKKQSNKRIKIDLIFSTAICFKTKKFNELNEQKRQKK